MVTEKTAETATATKRNPSIENVNFVRFLRELTGLDADRVKTESIGGMLPNMAEKGFYHGWEHEVHSYRVNILPEVEKSADKMIHSVAMASIFSEAGISAKVTKQGRLNKVSVDLGRAVVGDDGNAFYILYPADYRDRMARYADSDEFNAAVAAKSEEIQGRIAEFEKCFGICGNVTPKFDRDRGFVVDVQLSKELYLGLRADADKVGELSDILYESFGHQFSAQESPGRMLADREKLRISGDYFTNDAKWGKVELNGLNSVLESVREQGNNSFQAIVLQQDELGGINGNGGMSF
ncbi:MAG: hypothetical protein COV36_06870 [Alphaproteobacteria bacterium CG11_big_fil_rev_8_21_14_0_20_44_7]|nr:MAG: hypothetical protein COV36_06870 [Alphaproteobacteria bacterium CG11_big_fil_rev_8_21_14_0_20_44_7]